MSFNKAESVAATSGYWRWVGDVEEMRKQRKSYRPKFRMNGTEAAIADDGATPRSAAPPPGYALCADIIARQQACKADARDAKLAWRELRAAERSAAFKKGVMRNLKRATHDAPFMPTKHRNARRRWPPNAERHGDRFRVGRDPASLSRSGARRRLPEDDRRRRTRRHAALGSAARAAVPRRSRPTAATSRPAAGRRDQGHEHGRAAHDLGAPTTLAAVASGEGRRRPAEELLYATSAGLPSPHARRAVATTGAPRGRGASAPSSGSLRGDVRGPRARGAALSRVITVAGPRRARPRPWRGFAVLAFALVTCLRVLGVWSPTSAPPASRAFDDARRASRARGAAEEDGVLTWLRDVDDRVGDDAGRGGFAVGSEMSGGVRNVTFRDSVLGAGPQSRGIDVKTSVGRGGYIIDVTFENIRAPRPSEGERERPPALRDDPDVPGDDLVPVIGNLRFANVSGPTAASRRTGPPLPAMTFSCKRVARTLFGEITLPWPVCVPREAPVNVYRDYPNWGPARRLPSLGACKAACH
ncbi:glycosyl hydrolase [Aureococcus anophagefferens]|nr:glycosyl hydrolase [Aureococcus anophagefferens]